MQVSQKRNGFYRSLIWLTENIEKLTIGKFESPSGRVREYLCYVTKIFSLLANSSI